jgi:hypothetical protein
MRKRIPLPILFLPLLLFGCVRATPAPDSVSAADTVVAAIPVSPAPPTDSPVSNGRVFYVSPDGNDSAEGSREAPWRSPANAVQRLHPGDTLIFLDGKYPLRDFEHDILRPPSGEPNAWITLRGEEGARPVLAGGNNLLTAIDLSGASYLLLENLEITSDSALSGEEAYFRDGIEILGAPASHLILRNLYIHHVDEFGLNVQDVEDFLVENCRIEYAGFGAMGGPAGDAGGWRDVRVRNCVLAYSGHYYQGGDGSSRPYDRPDGFGIEASEGPILIENTVAAHNYGDGLDSKAANTTIRASIVAENSCDGVKLWGDNSALENVLIYGRGDGDFSPTPWASIVVDTETPNAVFTFRHVTVADSVPETYLLYVQYDHPEIPIRLIWENDIFAAYGAGRSLFLAPSVQLEMRHTLFFLPESETVLRLGEDTFSCNALDALGEGNFCADPRFLDEKDFHLRADSPAIDAGILSDVTVDLAGVPRDSAPDLGVYEWKP